MRLEGWERVPYYWLQRKPLRKPAAMAGKTFPSFPVHAQPTILRIWQEAHGKAWEVGANDAKAKPGRWFSRVLIQCNAQICEVICDDIDRMRRILMCSCMNQNKTTRRQCYEFITQTTCSRPYWMCSVIAQRAYPHQNPSGQLPSIARRPPPSMVFSDSWPPLRAIFGSASPADPSARPAEMYFFSIITIQWRPMGVMASFLKLLVTRQFIRDIIQIKTHENLENSIAPHYWPSVKGPVTADFFHIKTAMRKHFSYNDVIMIRAKMME